MGANLELAIKEHIAYCTRALKDAIETSSEQAISLAKEQLEKAKKMFDNPDLFFEEQRAMYLCTSI